MSTAAAVVCLVVLLLLWRMWRYIKGTLRHLEDDELMNFLEKRMSGNQLKQTREHILQCETCKERLDELTKNPIKMAPDRLLKRRF